MEDKYNDILEQKMCKEIKILENKYSGGTEEMTVQDLEKLNLLYHTLKSKATYEAMKDATEEYEAEGMSGRRGRSPMTGRYVSRDQGNSYADGYANGYSEAMSQNRSSGHYPPVPYPNRYY